MNVARKRREQQDLPPISWTHPSYPDRWRLSWTLEKVAAAAHFPEDGAADVQVLTRVLRDEATSRGARFLPRQEVSGIDNGAYGIASRRRPATRSPPMMSCSREGPSLAALTGLELPLFPVAHPYVYSQPGATWSPGPFMRWPEHHIYARVHHDRFGIGSYDHTPIPVDHTGLAAGAGLPWSEDFTPVITSAQRFLRPEARFTPHRRVNGVLAVHAG